MKRLFAGLFLAGVLILAVAYLAAEEDPARAPAAAPKADAGENAAVREAANGADAGGKSGGRHNKIRRLMRKSPYLVSNRAAANAAARFCNRFENPPLPG